MSVDPVLEFVRKEAAEEGAIERVRLFGSRARGDHHARSDYDLAVYAPRWSDTEWARWAEKLKEAVPSLAGLDLIRVTNETSKSLLKAIDTDGVTFYQRG